MEVADKRQKIMEPVLEWLRGDAQVDERVLGFSMAHTYKRKESLGQGKTLKDSMGHPCDAVMCIAGAIMYFHLLNQAKPPEYKEVLDLIGADTEEAYCLFYVLNWEPGRAARTPKTNRTDITPPIAIRTIEHWLSTGNIQWDL